MTRSFPHGSCSLILSHTRRPDYPSRRYHRKLSREWPYIDANVTSKKSMRLLHAPDKQAMRLPHASDRQAMQLLHAPCGYRMHRDGHHRAALCVSIRMEWEAMRLPNPPAFITCSARALEQPKIFRAWSEGEALPNRDPILLPHSVHCDTHMSLEFRSTIDSHHIAKILAASRTFRVFPRRPPSAFQNIRERVSPS